MDQGLLRLRVLRGDIRTKYLTGRVEDCLTLEKLVILAHFPSTS